MGTLSGKTWSPERQTIPGKLVTLSGSMGAYARSGTGDDLDLMRVALAELEGALE
jgi:hypothetical protein